MDIVPQFMPVYNVGAGQKVAVGSASAASSAVIGSSAVLLCSTSACYVVFAATPTSTNAGFFIPANTFVALACDPSYKIAVIRDTADGNLFATPLF